MVSVVQLTIYPLMKIICDLKMLLCLMIPVIRLYFVHNTTKHCLFCRNNIHLTGVMLHFVYLVFYSESGRGLLWHFRRRLILTVSVITSLNLIRFLFLFDFTLSHFNRFHTMRQSHTINRRKLQSMPIPTRLI